MAASTSHGRSSMAQEPKKKGVTRDNIGEIGSILRDLISGAQPTPAAPKPKPVENAQSLKQYYAEQAKQIELKMQKKKSESSGRSDSTAVTHRRPSPRRTQRTVDRQSGTQKLREEPLTAPEHSSTTFSKLESQDTKSEMKNSKNANTDAGFESDLSEALATPETSKHNASKKLSSVHEDPQNSVKIKSEMGDSGVVHDDNCLNQSPSQSPLPLVAHEMVEESIDCPEVTMNKPTQAKQRKATVRVRDNMSLEYACREPEAKGWSGTFQITRTGHEIGKAGVKVSVSAVSWKLAAQVIIRPKKVTPQPEPATKHVQIQQSNNMTSSICQELDDSVPELGAKQERKQKLQRRQTFGASPSKKIVEVPEAKKPVAVPAKAPEKIEEIPKPGTTPETHRRRAMLTRQSSAAISRVKRAPLKRQLSVPVAPRPLMVRGIVEGDGPEWARIKLRPTGISVKHRKQSTHRQHSPSPPLFVRIVLKAIPRIVDPCTGIAKPAPMVGPVPTRPALPTFVPKWRRAVSMDT